MIVKLFDEIKKPVAIVHEELPSGEYDIKVISNSTNDISCAWSMFTGDKK